MMAKVVSRKGLGIIGLPILMVSRDRECSLADDLLRSHTCEKEEALNGR